MTPPASIAELIEGVVRRAASLGPLPRGLPFLALDHPSGTALHLLEGFARRGIFRKYEHVLDVGAGLGATARWIAERLGCTAIATAASTTTIRAGRRLTRQAGLDGQVTHVATDAARLPFRDAAFTHVWIVEQLATVAAPERLLAEARRVVRPGGYLAAQELVATDGAATGTDRWRVLLLEAGFVDVSMRDVGVEAVETAPRLLAARQQLAVAARRGKDATRAAEWLEERARVAASLGREATRVVQLSARRP
jgi:ubiquinone/menaquinone biosynthesis C-methylase UbiE